MRDTVVEDKMRYFNIQQCTKCPYYWLSSLTYGRREDVELVSYRPHQMDEGCVGESNV